MVRAPGEPGSDTDIAQTTINPAGIETVGDLARWLRQLRRREARLRQDSQWSYRELAAKTGWSRAILAEYFAGRVLPPTERFDALVRLLGATPAEQGELATARDRVDERRRTLTPAGPAVVGSAVPHQLPAEAPGFIGRRAQVADLDGLLRRDRNAAAVVICAVTGTAGVGKTALAVHWAHRAAAHFPDGQLYVNLRGFDRDGRVRAPEEAVGGFLDAFEVAPGRIPSTVDGKAALYRSIMAGRRVLVLVDNALDADQVRPLLPGSPGSLVVVTSRNQLSGLVATVGARTLRLGLLTPAEGTSLLVQRLGGARVAAEPDAAHEIIERCARLPLALSIVAARAAAHPDFPLATFATELRPVDCRLDMLTGGDALSDVRTVLSWSYRVLSVDAARMFRLLGLHPGPDLSIRAAASLAGVPVVRAVALLGELCRVHLVTEHIPGRFHCHELLRAYAAELAQAFDDGDQRDRAVHRVLDHYAYTANTADRLVRSRRHRTAHVPPPPPGVVPEPITDRCAAFAWFAAEYRVLLAAIEQAAVAGLEHHTRHLVAMLTHCPQPPARCRIGGPPDGRPRFGPDRWQETPAALRSTLG